ncbi:MAG: ligase-associated DNA damage response exonuclease [Alphaproteobacteria bacterium]|nr:ligase-associated DNA damage response exonuclease [Alphaproteobacteria bacterium]
MRLTDLLTPRPEGLYCPPADAFIDPVRPVDRAIITHGHADHARAGHACVLATPETLAIMAVRYGRDFCGRAQALAYGEALRIGDVEIVLRPAGHVLGSAQVALTQGGVRAAVSGDYKRQPDPTCAPFEPIACDLFVTEATFALPVFRHPPAETEIATLLRSRDLFPDRAHLVGAYALGKAQRVIALFRQAGYDAPIYLHGALEALTALYERCGVALGDVRPVMQADKTALAGAIALCPPSAVQTPWARRFPDPITAFASGWMRIRARARQRGVELPLVISDHADWPDLQRTILETGAPEVWITHGEADALAHWCESAGVRARALHLVGYDDEGEQSDAAA